METRKYTIRVFEGEKEITCHENIEDLIAFGTRNTEEEDKTQVLLFHSEDLSNAGIFLLTRALLDRFDDAMPTILAACSIASATNDEIVGEINSLGDGKEDNWDEEEKGFGE